MSAPRMTVNGFAKRCGLPAHVIRFYARVGLLEPKRNLANGYKLFSEDHVIQIKFIRLAQALGLSLDEIGELLILLAGRVSPYHRMRAILEERVSENRTRLEQLVSRQRSIEHALASWDARVEDAADLFSVCRMLELFLV
jgi:DNA-binding transcriptional MerR regulator